MHDLNATISNNMRACSSNLFKLFSLFRDTFSSAFFVWQNFKWGQQLLQSLYYSLRCSSVFIYKRLKLPCLKPLFMLPLITNGTFKFSIPQIRVICRCSSLAKCLHSFSFFSVVAHRKISLFSTFPRLDLIAVSRPNCKLVASRRQLLSFSLANTCKDCLAKRFLVFPWEVGLPTCKFAFCCRG